MPSATITADSACAHCGTRERPNSSTPRNADSRKNAVSTSYAMKPPTTFDVAATNRLQFVPNWNGITMPDTTPIPNDTAKIRSQNVDSRA